MFYGREPRVKADAPYTIERGDPQSLREVVVEFHGLPSGSRDPEDVMQDWQNGYVFADSQQRSAERRKPTRGRSWLGDIAVSYLDIFADLEDEFRDLLTDKTALPVQTANATASAPSAR